MNIVIFDTETTSLEKPFCYNIGYCVVDASSKLVLVKRDFVVEQVWHNTMLFTTAYYAEKRPLYVSAMRAKATRMEKFGYICQQMVRDFKAFNVVGAYAYNSPFDDKVFQFNCDWFKCINPFDNIPIFDIRGYAHNFICDNYYKTFCEDYGKFTESGNYSTTAETVYQYLTCDPNFVEDHTALADSEIETMILLWCIAHGAELNHNYTVYRSIPRVVKKTFTVKYGNEVVYSAEVEKITYSKSKNTVILK